ncbi:DMT family transporter [Terrihabitans sp. B22-R8]|uniref:DMT family transporter n=1 Tax=Terrihabitans sp. B22-R8 TaxID=3425128 RepID=UPI00403CA11B
MSDKASARIPWAGYALAASGAFLFSSKSIVIKLAYAEGVDPETLLALRMVLALPFYLVIGGWAIRTAKRKASTSLNERRAMVHAALIGLLGYWFASYGDFKGLIYISAQFGRLILFTYPLFVVLLGAMFFGQKVRARSLLAFLVSYAGLALIFTQDFAENGSNAMFGVVWVTAAALAFALYQLLAREVIALLGAALFTCIAMSSASLAAIAQYLIMHSVELLSHRVLWLGLVLAIGATVLPSFLMNAALSRISAQANATISTMSPVGTILLAVLVLGERASLIDMLGGALVVAGVGFFTLASHKSG